MKKIFSVLFLLIATCQSIHAQIPNHGFEFMNPDSSIQFWGSNCAFSIGIGDSIGYDGPQLSLSTLSHSGMYALEMRNMFNYTTNAGYFACANSFNDSITFGFNTHFTILGYPESLQFYYRFKQNPFHDTAVSKVFIYNSNHFIIGEGSTTFWDENTSYQLRTIPINYISTIDTSDGDLVPAFAEIYFRTATNSSNAHLGTRLLIDDLTFTSPSIVEEQNLNEIQLYPNPVQQSIYVAGMKNEIFQYEIISLYGQMLQKGNALQNIDVSHLKQGTYFIKLQSQNGNTCIKKFVKQEN